MLQVQNPVALEWARGKGSDKVHLAPADARHRLRSKLASSAASTATAGAGDAGRTSSGKGAGGGAGAGASGKRGRDGASTVAAKAPRRRVTAVEALGSRAVKPLWSDQLRKIGTLKVEDAGDMLVVKVRRRGRRKVCRREFAWFSPRVLVCAARQWCACVAHGVAVA